MMEKCADAANQDYQTDATKCLASALIFSVTSVTPSLSSPKPDICGKDLIRFKAVLAALCLPFQKNNWLFTST